MYYPEVSNIRRMELRKAAFHVSVFNLAMFVICCNSSELKAKKPVEASFEVTTRMASFSF